MGKVIKFGNSARNLVIEGITELENAVTCTLGPKGRTVIIDKGNNHPVVTKDGISVGKFIEFSDKYKNIGANLIKDAAKKANSIAGDGSTTTILLTSELCKAGNELVSQGFDSVEVKRGFEKAAEDVIEVLEKNKVILEDEDDIFHIATISANNDETIGNYIKEAFTKIGDGGRVNIVDAHNRNGKTSVTFSNGLDIKKGFFTSAVVNTEMESCYFDEPRYFVYAKQIKDMKDILPIFRIIGKEPVVIVAPSYSDDFQTSFITNIESGTINAVAIGPDGVSKSDMDSRLYDIATITGATVIEGKEKISIDNFNVNMFGCSDSITVTKGKSSIVGGRGKPESIEKYVNSLKDSIEKGNDDETFKTDYEIALIKERIACLTGGISTIHIGGFTDIEVKEKIDRYEDAVNAVDAAISDGIIIGGGAGLLHAVKEVSDNHKVLENSVQETGYQKFLKILEMPSRRIIASTGKDPGYYAEKIKESENTKFGYNAKKEVFSDNLYKDGVIDPVKVIETALMFATSTAGTFITSDCVITDDNYNIRVTANDKIMME